MPSKKQRRRREKERRHEYEYVYVDDEGEEVEVEEATPATGAKPKPKPSANQAPAKGGRGGRVVEPPSWRRVGRRALFLAPVLVALIYFTSKDKSSPQILITTLFFLLVFLPFSYVMDTMLYRSYLKRTGQAPPARERPSSRRPPKEPKAKA